VIKQLMIANAVVFVAQKMIPGLEQYGAIRPALVWEGGYLWQPFTYMWLHGGLGHIAMNCFALWMFGSPVAMAWGHRRFLRFYLVCGVGAGAIIATYPYLSVALGIAPMASLAYFTLGASGAVYGVLLAYSLTWPDRTIMLIFPPVAFRAIWLIPGLFFISFMMDPRGNVSHIGHLGGVIVGWLLMRRRGEAGNVLTLKHLRYRWRRYRMRQKLRAVHQEEYQARRRPHDDDHTLH
jgi:membrane associated rhomboid family serine protease